MKIEASPESVPIDNNVPFHVIVELGAWLFKTNELYKHFASVYILMYRYHHNICCT